MNINEQIKRVMEVEDVKPMMLVERINEGKPVKDSAQNILQKLKRESIRFIDVEEVLTALGYELVIQKKKETFAKDSYEKVRLFSEKIKKDPRIETRFYSDYLTELRGMFERTGQFTDIRKQSVAIHDTINMFLKKITGEHNLVIDPEIDEKGVITLYSTGDYKEYGVPDIIVFNAVKLGVLENGYELIYDKNWEDTVQTIELLTERKIHDLYLDFLQDKLLNGYCPAEEK